MSAMPTRKSWLCGKAKNNRIIARAVIRLLKHQLEDETVPVLVIERIYSRCWAGQIGLGILKWAMDKAKIISEANDSVILVATSDVGLTQTIKSKFPKLMKKKSFKFKLPRSLNEYEYSDTFGGRLSAGSSVSAELHYWPVGEPEDRPPEDNDDDDDEN